jgi:hypothetical protein
MPRLALALLAIGCSQPPPCSDCGGICVDLQSDDANCGACGQACAQGTRCESGRCVTTCSGLVCGDTCVDAMNDPNNCGACGVTCSPMHATGVCVAGQCGHSQCDEEWFDCDSDPRNGCESLGASCLVDACGRDDAGVAHSCYFQGISDDGKRVLFTSPNPFFEGDDSFSEDLFLFDVPTGSVEWLTRPLVPGTPGPVSVPAAGISGDGTRVAFTSANDLVPADSNGQTDLYLIDLSTGVLSYSPSPPDAGPLSPPFSILLSRTGRYLAGYVQGELGLTAVMWRDLETGAYTIIPTPVQAVSMSGDGLTVCVEQQLDQKIVPALFDGRDGGTRALLASDAGIFKDHTFASAAIDADGRRLAFAFIGAAGGLNEVVVTAPTGPLPAQDGGSVFMGATGPTISSDGELMAFCETQGVSVFSSWSVVEVSTGRRLPVPSPFSFELQTPGTGRLSGDGRTLVVSGSSLGAILLSPIDRP